VGSLQRGGRMEMRLFTGMQGHWLNTLGDGLLSYTGTVTVDQEDKGSMCIKSGTHLVGREFKSLNKGEGVKGFFIGNITREGMGGGGKSVWGKIVKTGISRYNGQW